MKTLGEESLDVSAIADLTEVSGLVRLAEETGETESIGYLMAGATASLGKAKDGLGVVLAKAKGGATAVPNILYGALRDRVDRATQQLLGAGVNCGNHSVDGDCGQCTDRDSDPQGFWCNGDCKWDVTGTEAEHKCVLKHGLTSCDCDEEDGVKMFCTGHFIFGTNKVCEPCVEKKEECANNMLYTNWGVKNCETICFPKPEPRVSDEPATSTSQTKPSTPAPPTAVQSVICAVRNAASTVFDTEKVNKSVIQPPIAAAAGAVGEAVEKVSTLGQTTAGAVYSTALQAGNAISQTGKRVASTALQVGKNWYSTVFKATILAWQKTAKISVPLVQKLIGFFVILTELMRWFKRSWKEIWVFWYTQNTPLFLFRAGKLAWHLPPVVCFMNLEFSWVWPWILKKGLKSASLSVDEENSAWDKTKIKVLNSIVSGYCAAKRKIKSYANILKAKKLFAMTQSIRITVDIEV